MREVGVVIRVVRLLLVVALIGLVGCNQAATGLPPGGPASPATAPAPAATSPAPAATSPAPAATPGRAVATAGPKQAERSPVTPADRLAGVRSNSVRWKSGGRLRTVPGSSKAPGRGRVYQVRVQVESGLDIDRTAFATFVLATLNDQRSWTEHGRRRFARTDGPADITVVLASPQTSAAICAPLRTYGKLSCRTGSRAVLTLYRWIKAIGEYSGDRTGYRHYVVNHEVGHVLGHGHQYCAGRGKLAPLMMQQTKGLKGCRPNPWPHP